MGGWIMNINDFCNEYEVRDYIRKPFNVGDRTFATTGYLIVSIPLDEKYDFTENEHLLKVVPEMVNVDGVDFEPMPKDLVFPLPEECGMCKGTGKATKKECYECDGEGEIELETDYNYYSFECKTCYGDGKVKSESAEGVCDDCGGDGEKLKDGSVVNINDFTVNPHYLKQIMAIGELEISLDKEKMMMKFRCGDVIGSVMGVRT